MAIFAIFPLLLILLIFAGIVVLTLGVRGRPVFSSPHCAKCSYDLRAMNFVSQDVQTCPECGAKLNEPHAVTFGRLQRRPRIIVMGVVLILLGPALAMLLMLARNGAIGVSSVGPGASSSRTTPALLTSLKSTLNQPWDWQELEKRLRNGSLTTSDVDAAFGVLIADLKAKRAAGQSVSHLPWLDGFFNTAVQTNAVSPPVLLKVSQAFYGDAPTIRTRGKFRDKQPIDFELDIESPWDLPSMNMCWVLSQIKAEDGTVLEPESYYSRSPEKKSESNPDEFSGTNRGGGVHAKTMHSLSPGEHELSFTFDMGTVPQNTTFHGLDGKPGTVDKWPKPIGTWQTVVKQKVTIVPSDKSVIDLVSDTSEDPFKKTLRISVEQALARASSRNGGGVEIFIKWKLDGGTDPAVCYHVDLMAGAKKISFGTIMNGRLARGTTSGYSDTTFVKSLPADVKTIDILFTPDAKAAEQYIGLTHIWGGEHKIEQVPLERFDIRPATNPNVQ